KRRSARPSDAIGGPGYACVRIVADAIERAGRLDPRASRDAMAPTNMPTVVGPVRFRPDGTGIVPTVFVQWQEGKQELVWPKALGAARLLYPVPPWRGR